MNGDFQWPFPQTEGRQRDLNTVAPDPNEGMVARPVRFQAQSLLTQVGDYVNNWLGNIGTANAVKDSESLGMAAKVSSTAPQGFSTIVETYGQAPSPFETMADEFMDRLGLKVSSVEPGSAVAGRPVAPTQTNYQYANNIDKAIKDVRSAGEEFIDQVKGYFNISYEGPVKPSAMIAEPIGIGALDGNGSALVILGIAYILLVA